MKLNHESLKSGVWERKGYRVPGYPRQAMIDQTRQTPQWVHFGAGNIFRSFIAQIAQSDLDQGLTKTGIIVGEGFDFEILDRAYRPFDDLCIAVTLRAQGGIEKTVVGSIAQTLAMETETGDWRALEEVFRAPTLQMASFTITEKGYALADGTGRYLPPIQADFERGPLAPQTYLGKVCALCYARYCAGGVPLALVSMDNCSHNGERLRTAVLSFARQWTERGLADPGFLRYVEDPRQMAFPWTAIDKITPRPDKSVEKALCDDGLEDATPVETKMHTYVAPFVNAEEAQYLIIEDAFPNGRPPLSAPGVYVTDRETVEKFERMKVCTCLNPIHTALAVFGCLLGYGSIADEMKNGLLRKLAQDLAYDEALPVVVNPGIIDPAEFVDQVIEVRLPNPYMPDTPQRIATDTSQKLSIRFGETRKAYMASETLRVEDLRLIPLVLAGWCRYLLGIDDEGNAFSLSPDPLLETICPLLADIKLDEEREIGRALKPLLSDEAIFGLNLYQAGLGSRVEGYFARMLTTGGVRSTLAAAVNGKE